MSRALRLDIDTSGVIDAATLRKALALQSKKTARGRKSSAIAQAEKKKFELALAFQLRAAQVPEFETQVLYVTGRKITGDFGWREQRLLVEVQGGIWQRGGGGHSHPMFILRDIEKARLAVLMGWSWFPVTTDEVTNGQALRLIELALQAKGWKR